jgi:hypothetical protein
MTVRKNGADTGTLKTRMGLPDSKIRLHHGMGIFRVRFLIRHVWARMAADPIDRHHPLSPGVASIVVGRAVRTARQGDPPLLILPVQPHFKKFSISRFTQINPISLAVPSHRRGVSRSSRTQERDAVAAGSVGAELGFSPTTRTNGADADGEVVWF